MSKSIPVPEELRPQADEGAVVKEFVDAVSRCDELARRLVLRGVFCIDDPSPLFAAIGAVAEHEGEYRKHEKRFREAKRTVASATLNEKQEAALRAMEDIAYLGCNEWGEAGYLLGLAVGQRIRLASLLDGGAR